MVDKNNNPTKKEKDYIIKRWFISGFILRGIRYKEKVSFPKDENGERGSR